MVPVMPMLGAMPISPVPMCMRARTGVRMRVDGCRLGAGIELHIDTAITAVGAGPMMMMRDRRRRIAGIAALVATSVTATGPR